MEASGFVIGKKVTLRYRRTPVLCGDITLPSGTEVKVDSFDANPRLFWAKVVWQGKELCFLLDRNEVDESPAN